MSIRFHFAKEETENGYVQRPVIPIQLKHDGNILSTEALIDSGSDCIFLPYDTAEALELKISKDSHKTIGLEGQTKCYESKCQLIIQDKLGRERYSFNIRASVGLAKYSEEQRIIIGREPIFQHFKITFDQSNNSICLAKIAKQIGSISKLRKK